MMSGGYLAVYSSHFSSLSLWLALMKLEQRATPQTPKESGDE